MPWAFQWAPPAAPPYRTKIRFQQDPQTKSWLCRGEQYASGGDDKNQPLHALDSGDVDAQKKRTSSLLAKSIAWAVNYGMPAYLRSTLAYGSSAAWGKTGARPIAWHSVKSALAINPYNFLVVDPEGLELADTPRGQFHLWETLHAALAKVHDRSGCPAKGLYDQTVRNKLFRRLAHVRRRQEKSQHVWRSSN